MRSTRPLRARHQGALIEAYCAAEGAVASKELKVYLPALKAKDTKLDNDKLLRALLKSAGNDPVMRRVQDDFFDYRFWWYAAAKAEGRGIYTPLGTLTIYDSRIHGSFDLISSRTTQKHGSPLMIRRAGMDREIHL